MHLVRLGFQPREEPLRAVPDALVPVAFALDDPLATFGTELTPGCVDWNAALLRKLDQIVLTLFIRLRLPGFDGAAAEGLAFVRDDQAIVDTDRSSKAATAFASPDGRIERKQARVGLAVGQVAFRAVELVGITPGLQGLRGIRIVNHLYVDATLSNTQGCFEGFENTATVS